MTPHAQLWPSRVRAAYADTFGDRAAVDEGFGPLAVDVPAEEWVDALLLARDGLDCAFFDFLTAVDELGDGFRLACHVAQHQPGSVVHLVVRTRLPRESPVLASASHVYPGARWHERETHEMFGVDFAEAGQILELDKLLLPEEFEGHPLRKDFVLASRVAKPWPGAKEPGESDEAGHGAAPRRRTRPPGVPEPEQWGPREPGSEKPDPLAAAAAAAAGPAARPRRARTARPAPAAPGGSAGAPGGTAPAAPGGGAGEGGGDA